MKVQGEFGTINGVVRRKVFLLTVLMGNVRSRLILNMITDSIDIQPPYARNKRVFIARHKDRPDSNYIQKRDFNRQGLIEKESWKLDNVRQLLI